MPVKSPQKSQLIGKFILTSIAFLMVAYVLLTLLLLNWNPHTLISLNRDLPVRPFIEFLVPFTFAISLGYFFTYKKPLNSQTLGTILVVAPLYFFTLFLLDVTQTQKQPQPSAGMSTSEYLARQADQKKIEELTRKVNQLENEATEAKSILGSIQLTYDESEYKLISGEKFMVLSNKSTYLPRKELVRIGAESERLIEIVDFSGNSDAAERFVQTLEMEEDTPFDLRDVFVEGRYYEVVDLTEAEAFPSSENCMTGSGYTESSIYLLHKDIAIIIPRRFGLEMCEGEEPVRTYQEENIESILRIVESIKFAN